MTKSSCSPTTDSNRGCCFDACVGGAVLIQACFVTKLRTYTCSFAVFETMRRHLGNATRGGGGGGGGEPVTALARLTAVSSSVLQDGQALQHLLERRQLGLAQHPRPSAAGRSCVRGAADIEEKRDRLLDVCAASLDLFIPAGGKGCKLTAS